MHIANSREITKTGKKRRVTTMLRNEIKCSIRATKGRKQVKDKRGKNHKDNKYTAVINIIDTSPTITIITLTLNGLNAPNKD